MRGEKEANWSTFATRSADSPGNTYCFKDLTLSWPSVGSCGTTFGLNNTFKREAVLVGTETQVDVEITVQWKDGAKTYSVPLDTVYVLWE